MPVRTIKIDLEANKRTREIIERDRSFLACVQIHTEVNTLLRQLKSEDCMGTVLEKEFRDKYGLSKISNLGLICQIFYEKGMNKK